MSNVSQCQLSERPPQDEWELVSRADAHTSDKPLILWDGSCGLCFESVLWLKKRDQDQFVATPYQLAPTPPMSRELETACAEAVHIITPDGRVLRAGRAVLFALSALGYRRSTRLLLTPPFIWLVEIGYRLVADNRHHLTRWIRPILRREAYK